MWVDIENGILYESNWTTRQVQTYQLHLRLSAIIEQYDGGVVLGVEGGLVRFNFDLQRIDWLADIEKEIPGMRCNDGAADATGRIWMGVMDIHAKSAKGALYCIHHDLTVEKKIGKLTIPNGIVWSLDQSLMYFVDSTAQNIDCYLFDAATGDIRFDRTAIPIPKTLGTPDGITMDEDGMLWVALYGGFGLSRWNPVNGELLQVIELPVPNVTNCCFAGPELDVLVITTARENLSPDDLEKYPQSGDVLMVKDTGTRGLKSNQTGHSRQK